MVYDVQLGLVRCGDDCVVGEVLDGGFVVYFWLGMSRSYALAVEKFVSIDTLEEVLRSLQEKA